MVREIVLGPGTNLKRLGSKDKRPAVFSEEQPKKAYVCMCVHASVCLCAYACCTYYTAIHNQIPLYCTRYTRDITPGHPTLHQSAHITVCYNRYTVCGLDWGPGAEIGNME